MKININPDYSNKSQRDLVSLIRKTTESKSVKSFPSGIPLFDEHMLGGFSEGLSSIMISSEINHKAIASQLSLSFAKEGNDVILISSTISRRDLADTGIVCEMQRANSQEAIKEPEVSLSSLILFPNKYSGEEKKHINKAVGCVNSYFDRISVLNHNSALLECIKAQLEESKSTIIIVDDLRSLARGFCSSTKMPAYLTVLSELEALAERYHIPVIITCNNDRHFPLKLRKYLKRACKSVINLGYCGKETIPGHDENTSADSEVISFHEESDALRLLSVVDYKVLYSRRLGIFMF